MTQLWAGFGFFNDNARKTICECLMSIPHSNIVSEEDKKRFMINFDDNMYGETYLLMDPGIQIVPSHMGRKSPARNARIFT